ncbi:hypothetical protein O9853_16405 [Vibrio lentus]|nr:hypothetical protein [Vibrio lentus]
MFNNKEMPLTELFEKQFSPMSSNSDQIGRQPKESKEPLKNWLIRELNIPTGEKKSRQHAYQDKSHKYVWHHCLAVTKSTGRQ